MLTRYPCYVRGLPGTLGYGTCAVVWRTGTLAARPITRQPAAREVGVEPKAKKLQDQILEIETLIEELLKLTDELKEDQANSSWGQPI